MPSKQPAGSLLPIAPVEERPPVKSVEGTRPKHVQTVRMDAATLRALQIASIDRGISQNDIILKSLRRDLGLE